MKHYALITAKGSNSTLKNKNLIHICGKPSVAWSIEAASKSDLISKVFLSTDCIEIANVGNSLGCKIIWRGPELCQPDTNHGDVILHAIKEIESLEDCSKDASLTTLLGNTVMTTSQDIDNAIKLLIDNKYCSGVLSYWVAQDDHPLRALKIDEDGYLKSYLDVSTPDTNRQSYPPAYFYDQGPWTSTFTKIKQTSIERQGCGPWWWLGDKCIGFERQWVTGRDTHTMLDVKISEWWIENFLQKLN